MPVLPEEMIYMTPAATTARMAAVAKTLVPQSTSALMPTIRWQRVQGALLVPQETMPVEVVLELVAAVVPVV